MWGALMHSSLRRGVPALAVTWGGKLPSTRCGCHGALSRAFVVERPRVPEPSLGGVRAPEPDRSGARRGGWTSGARTGPRAERGGAERSRAEPDRRRRRSRARTDGAQGRRRSRAARGGAASGPAMADEGPRKGSVSALMGRTNGLTKPAALAGGPAKPGGTGGSRKLVIKNFRGGCAPGRSERGGRQVARSDRASWGCPAGPVPAPQPALFPHCPVSALQPDLSLHLMLRHVPRAPAGPDPAPPGWPGRALPRCPGLSRPRAAVDPLSPQTGRGCLTTTLRTRGGSFTKRSRPSRAAHPSGTTWRSCTR